MRLRWLVWCDENGRKTEPVLQYKPYDEALWEDVEYVELKEWDNENGGD